MQICLDQAQIFSKEYSPLWGFQDSQTDLFLGQHLFTVEHFPPEAHLLISLLSR